MTPCDPEDTCMQLDPVRALNLIDGEARPALTAGTFERRSPVDGSVIAIVSRSGADDVAAAVGAARRAWAEWSRRGPVARGALLRTFAAALDEHADELVTAVRLETGKPERDLRGELGAAQELAYFLASEGRRMYGRTIPSAVPGKQVATERAPIGVAGLIVAANTPLPNYAWKVLPALLCGNTVVLKPSEHTPLSAQLFVRALHAAGIPAGAVNLVHGFGTEAGTALVEHPYVDLVSFTGGTDVGRDIAARTGARLAKTCLELGGKNPLVVCDDADVARAAKDAVASAFSNAGQRCAAGSRIIVDESVLPQFLDHFMGLLKELVVGPGDDADLGPMISETALSGILERVDTAQAKGAELLAGGHRLTGATLDSGAYLAPTALLVKRGEPDPLPAELFGPVTVLHVVRGFDEAVARADDTVYGLTAAIHTADMDRAREFIDSVQAGMVVVNGPTFGSEPHTPFGGFRASGNGFRECGTEVLDFYSEWKAVSTWTRPPS